MKIETIIHPLYGKLAIADLDENEALLILTSLPSVGIMKSKQLIHHFGSATKALLAGSEEIAQLPGFNGKIAKEWQQWPDQKEWRKNILLVRNHGTRLISSDSIEYPKRLLEFPDAPVLLYIKGELKPCDMRCIAIVGTRQPTIYGQEMARLFGYELASLGFTIVSGLARGVDTAAHLGALESGRTLGVIGSGLADIYPAENRLLAEKMQERGAVLSEFAMATPPDRPNFPQRNRIVAGMTLATLLIEAPIKSGAMITMEQAFAKNRRLFAIPGRADSEHFRGNHALIKSGRAQLVESPRDVVSCFEDLFGALPQVKKRGHKIPLDNEEKKLLDFLPDQEVPIDQLIAGAKLPTAALNAVLMGLVLKGLVKEFPGKVYKKVGVAG